MADSPFRPRRVLAKVCTAGAPHPGWPDSWSAADEG